MSNKQVLKTLRKAFTDGVLKRDGYECKVCGRAYKLDSPLDAHHIINRSDFPNGGYALENGISLCYYCHIAAEEAQNDDRFNPKFGINALYERIGSNYQKAYEASKALHEPYIYPSSGMPLKEKIFTNKGDEDPEQHA